MGVYQSFDASIASFSSLSNAVDLSMSHGKNFLVIPSMTSNSEVYLRAADSMAGTYRAVYHPPINSSTVAVNRFIVPSAITNAVVEIPNGLRYVKVETSATVSFTAGFQIICGGTY